MKEREALKLALEALENFKGCLPEHWETFDEKAITAIKEVLANHIPDAKNMVAQPEQEPTNCRHCGGDANAICAGQCKTKTKEPEQEPVTWRNAAIRVGEDLCSVGPFGYYDMTAEQWLDWALSVVTVHAPPKRTWVGLTDEERDGIFELHHTRLGGWDYSGDTVMYEGHFEDAVVAIEAKLKEKNNG